MGGKPIRVRSLPKSTHLSFIDINNTDGRPNSYFSLMAKVFGSNDQLDWDETDIDWVLEDIGAASRCSCDKWSYRTKLLAGIKCDLIIRTKVHFQRVGIQFDEFNGLDPTKESNIYKAYEFSALWMWNCLEYHSQCPLYKFDERWFKRFGPVLKSVAKKYPKYTAVAISLVSGNDISPGKMLRSKFLDCSGLQDEYDKLAIKF